MGSIVNIDIIRQNVTWHKNVFAKFTQGVGIIPDSGEEVEQNSRM